MPTTINVLKITTKNSTWESSSFSIKVNYNSTVFDVRVVLQNRTGIPISEQLIIAHTADDVLLLSNNNQRVNSFYCLKSRPLWLNLYTTLSPRIKMVILNINCKDPPIQTSVDVWSIMRLEELKKRIDEMVGIPPYRQRLSLNFRQAAGSPTLSVPFSDGEMLEDMLPDCNMEYPVFLEKLDRPQNVVLSPVKVVLEEANLKATFKLDLDRDTVYSLMGEIRSDFASQVIGRNFRLGIRVGDEVLPLNGVRTLASYEVEANHKLHILVQPKPVASFI